MTKRKKQKSNPQMPNGGAKNVPNHAVTGQKKANFTLPRGLLQWLPLTLILVAATLFRLQYLDIPLERDESFYSYIGKLALSGGKPYVDFYEMKPPVLFYSYAVLLGIFGYSATGIHLAATFLSVGITYFTYLIAKKLGGQQVACLSAMVYALWSLSSGVYGAYLMSENIQLIWGLPAILWGLNYARTTNVKQLFAVGVFLSLSFLSKQTSIALSVILGLYWLVQWYNQRENTSFVTFFKPLLWTVLGFFTTIALVLLALWAVGSLKEAAFWLLEYPTLYMTDISDADAKMAFMVMQQIVIPGYEGYLIAGALGFLSLFMSKKTIAQKALLISWTLLTLCSIAMGKRFYGHYWLFALPVLSILGSLFFKKLSDKLAPKMGNGAAKISLMLGFAWATHVLFTKPEFYFNPSLSEISRRYSPGNPYLDHQVLSKYLEKIIPPTAQLAVLGSDPQYFIYLNKTSPIRHIYFPFMTHGKFNKMTDWQAETIENFKKTKPEYVILNKYPFAWMYKPGADQGLYDGLYGEIRKHYELVAFVENPGESAVVDVKMPVDKNKMPTTPSYIAVLKRRIF